MMKHGGVPTRRSAAEPAVWLDSASGSADAFGLLANLLTGANFDRGMADALVDSWPFSLSTASAAGREDRAKSALAVFRAAAAGCSAWLKSTRVPKRFTNMTANARKE